MSKIGVNCLRFVSKRETVRVSRRSHVWPPSQIGLSLASIRTSSGTNLLPAAGRLLIAILRAQTALAISNRRSGRVRNDFTSTLPKPLSPIQRETSSTV